MKLSLRSSNLALPLFLIVLASRPKPTEPATITVGTGGTCVSSPPTNFCDDVEGAIAAATAGDTVEIADGCYVIDAQVVVDKDITLVGESQEGTILSLSFNTASSGDPRGWFLIEEGINIDASSLTFDGIDCSDGTTQRLVWQAFRHRGSGTFSDVAFKNIRFQNDGSPYAGTAIAAFGASSNVNVINSSFEEMGRIGVLYFGSGVTGLFQGNVYTGKGDGDWLDYALDISAGANIRVERNTITANTGEALSDGSASACLLVSTFFGSGTSATIVDNVLDSCTIGVAVGFNTDDTSDVTIVGNTISNNEFGVTLTNAVGITGSANRNAITGNTVNGFFGTDSTPFDATCNWWGSVDGPSGDGTGSGDAVTGSVTFDPFLLNADIANAPCQSQAPVCDVDYSLTENDSISSSSSADYLLTGTPVCLETFCDGSPSSFETVCVDTTELQNFEEPTGPEGIRFVFGCCAPPLQSGDYPNYCSGLTVCADETDPVVPCEFADTCDIGSKSTKGSGKGGRLGGRDLRRGNGKGKKSKKSTQGVAACFNGVDLCLNELAPKDVAIGSLATCGPCL